MQDSVLETLLVVLYMIEIWTQNLWNFIAKFGSKAEICWKLEELNRDFLNNYKITNELQLWKKSAELVNTGGAAREFITDEFSIDLDDSSRTQ
jgi:hypothetical protein